MSVAVVASRVVLALIAATCLVGGSVWCAIDTGVWWYGVAFGLGVTVGPAAIVGLMIVATGD